jgi:hypothetical protein
MVMKEFEALLLLFVNLTIKGNNYQLPLKELKAAKAESIIVWEQMDELGYTTEVKEYLLTHNDPVVKIVSAILYLKYYDDQDAKEILELAIINREKWSIKAEMALDLYENGKLYRNADNWPPLKNIVNESAFRVDVSPLQLFEYLPIQVKDIDLNYPKDFLDRCMHVNGFYEVITFIYRDQQNPEIQIYSLESKFDDFSDAEKLCWVWIWMPENKEEIFEGYPELYQLLFEDSDDY